MAKGSQELAALRKELTDLANAKAGVTKTTTRLTDATAESSMTVRSALLNFRMFSFAIRTLRREFGVTSPVIEKFSQVLIVASALGTGIVSGHKLLTEGLTALSGKAGEGMTALAGLNAAFKAGSAAVLGLSIAVGALIGFAFGTWIGEQISPVRQMNIALKAYKDTIEGLTQSLSALKTEQAGLGAEGAMYAAAVAKINYEIQLQGFATDAQTESLKMLGNMQARLTMQQAQAKGVSALTAADIARAEFEKSQIAKEKQEYGSAALGRLNPLTGTAQGPGGLMGQIGRVAAGWPSPSKPIEILVDFTGSVFGGGTDVEGAARRGITEGIQDAGRFLEMLRRGG